MTSNHNQRKEQKQQSHRTEKINESIKKGTEDSHHSYERFRHGNAGDSTNNTGPRKDK
jgi:hypothetical protein